MQYWQASVGALVSRVCMMQWYYGLSWQGLQAGSAGLAVPVMNRMLGLDAKKNARRLDSIGKLLGVIETEVQEGKNVMRHWVATPAMLLQHHQASSPPSGLALQQHSVQVWQPRQHSNPQGSIQCNLHQHWRG